MVIKCPSITKPICFKDGKLFHVDFFSQVTNSINLGPATRNDQGFYLCEGLENGIVIVICKISLKVAGK